MNNQEDGGPPWDPPTRILMGISHTGLDYRFREREGYPSHVYLSIHCLSSSTVANFDPGTFSVMHCEFCSAGFDTRAGLSSHARAHLRDFGITNWDITISPIHILRELFSSRPDLQLPTAPPRSPGSSVEEEGEEEGDGEEEEDEEEKKESELERKVKEVVGVKLEGEPCQMWAPGAPPSPHSPKHSIDHCVKQKCEGTCTSLIDCYIRARYSDCV